MHNAPLRQVIGVGVVLGDAVIPNSHVVRLPAPAHLKVRFSDVSKQEAEQRLALFLRHVDDAGSKALIDKQRLLPGHRMGAHHRMQQRRIFRDRLQPALMLLFAFAVFVLLKRFAKIMLRAQAA